MNGGDVILSAAQRSRKISNWLLIISRYIISSFVLNQSATKVQRVGFYHIFLFISPYLSTSIQKPFSWHS